MWAACQRPPPLRDSLAVVAAMTGGVLVGDGVRSDEAVIAPKRDELTTVRPVRAMFDFSRDLRTQQRPSKPRTGNTPEKVAEDARRARRGTPTQYRSSAEPALKAAVAIWLYRSPLR